MQLEEIENSIDLIKMKDEFTLRFTVLENWKEEMQVEMVNQLLDQVMNRLNLNIDFYLPKIGKLLTNFEAL